MKNDGARIEGLVSIVLPAHNAERTLPACLRSLREQTWPHYELLCVENGSTDNTLVLLRREAEQDPRLRVFALPEPSLVEALNYGLAQARGEFIARMDADDLCLPERLEKQVMFLRAHPAVGLLGAGALLRGEGRNGEAGRICNPTNDAVIRRNLRLPCLTPHFLHPSVMFRPGAIPIPLVYRAPFLYAEDYDLWLRLTGVTQAANLPEPLLLYALPGKNSARMRAPGRAALSCAVAWMDERLGGALSRKIFDPRASGLDQNAIFQALDSREKFEFSLALYGFSLHCGLRGQDMQVLLEQIAARIGRGGARAVLEAMRPFSGPLPFADPRRAKTAGDMYALYACTGQAGAEDGEERAWIADFYDGLLGSPPGLRAELKRRSGMGDILDKPAQSLGGYSPLLRLADLLHQEGPALVHADRRTALRRIAYFIRVILPELPGETLHPLFLQKLSRPSSFVPDAGRDGITLLLEAFHALDPDNAGRFPLDTRQGRIGWLGFFCLWIKAELPWYSHPAWLSRLLSRPSPFVPDAGREGGEDFSILDEAIWRGDQWLRDNYDIFSPEGRLAFTAWLRTRQEALV